MGNHNQPKSLFIGPSQNLALSRSVYQSLHHTQHFLDWNPSLINRDHILRIVNDLTLLVYERLLSGPGISSHCHERINALPDDYSVGISTPQLNSFREYKAPQSTVDLTEPRFPSQQEALQRIGAEESNPNTLVSEINEYLLSMNLDELSEQEKEYVGRNDGISRNLSS